MISELPTNPTNVQSGAKVNDVTRAFNTLQFGVEQRADNSQSDAIALCKRAVEFKPKSDSECPMLLAALICLMEDVAQQHT